ncbi:MAG: PEGA domain-containing protein [Planctomycetia bacterium]|nr:PEGA domain-containing protein [Planctomycetia bacterium]
MQQYRWLLGVVACAASLAGCVDRRYVITSDPPGAVVYKNGQPLGATPVDDHFTYYGKYEFVLVKDGYETTKEVQEITTPWYQYFPIDFFAENVWPGRVVDARRFHYEMKPAQAVRTDVLLDQAQNLRNRGHTIAPPEATAATPPPVTPPPSVGGPMPAINPPPPEPPQPTVAGPGR